MTNIDEVNKFLTGGRFEFHNMANIGGDTFRLMYRDAAGKMQCYLAPLKD